VGPHPGKRGRPRRCARPAMRVASEEEHQQLWQGIPVESDRSEVSRGDFEQVIVLLWELIDTHTHTHTHAHSP
jgi:hypothetical protein